MWQIISFTIGSATVLLALFALGITRGHRISQKRWAMAWFLFSLALAFFIVAAFAFQPDLTVFSLGGAVGYIVAVAIHTMQHASS
jgi:succinate-acetate transporter protein